MWWWIYVCQEYVVNNQGCFGHRVVSRLFFFHVHIHLSIIFTKIMTKAIGLTFSPILGKMSYITAPFEWKVKWTETAAAVHSPPWTQWTLLSYNIRATTVHCTGYSGGTERLLWQTFWLHYTLYQHIWLLAKAAEQTFLSSSSTTALLLHCLIGLQLVEILSEGS